MKESQYQFLSLLGCLPARLTAEQSAWVINCQPHDIPVLVTARLLKPLGSAPPNSVKYFATTELLERIRDRAWLERVTNAVIRHWQKRNQRRRSDAQAARSGESLLPGVGLAKPTEL